MLSNNFVREANINDISSITDIYNQGIRSGLGTFETSLREEHDILLWFSKPESYPILVAENERGCVGFARLFEYRPRKCYAGIAEFSIYLNKNSHGKGIGTHLLSELLKQARHCGFHKVVSRIFTFNVGSRALCKKLGFREVGIYQRHGQLNGKWLDVVIVEYLVSKSR